MVSRLFCFLCFTSPVSLTSFYTEDEPRRHTPRSSISFIISSCVRFCVISSYYLIADHHDVCLITDRLFEMEATLIKVLHCQLTALHVILFNAFIHSIQFFTLNRFKIKMCHSKYVMEIWPQSKFGLLSSQLRNQNVLQLIDMNNNRATLSNQ